MVDSGMGRQPVLSGASLVPQAIGEGGRGQLGRTAVSPRGLWPLNRVPGGVCDPGQPLGAAGALGV